MNEGLKGILILLGVAVAVALASHAVIKKYLAASLVAACVSVVAFQVLNYAHIGYVDPFLSIAVVVSAPVCLVLSLLVGLPFQWNRKGRVHQSKGKTP